MVELKVHQKTRRKTCAAYPAVPGPSFLLEALHLAVERILSQETEQRAQRMTENKEKQYDNWSFIHYSSFNASGK